MQIRRIPPATIKVGTSRITLTRKCLPALAQNAIERGLAFAKQFDDDPDPLGTLRMVHDDWALLKDCAPQVEAHICALRAAADALSGEAIEHPPHPAVDLALMVRSHFDALAAVEPDAADDDLVETATLVREAADVLAADLKTFAGKRQKHDVTVCRELVARAVVSKRTDPLAVAELNFELPDEIEHLWGEFERDRIGSAAQTIKAGVSKFFADRAEAARVVKNRARTKQRREFEAKIARVWS